MKKIAAKFTMVAVSAFFATAAIAQTDTTKAPVPDEPVPDSTPAPVPEPVPEPEPEPVPAPDTTKAPELGIQQSVQHKQQNFAFYTDIYASNRSLSAIKADALKDENESA